MTALQAPEQPRTPHRVHYSTPARHRRPLRGLFWLVALSVVLLAVAHAGGGLYVASRIESGALANRPGQPIPAFDDVRVVGVSGKAVELRRAADAGENFDAAATYGLAREGGTGIVGPATPRPGGTVTRPLQVLQGTPPRRTAHRVVERRHRPLHRLGA